mgnify:CR=1 FL=1
MIARPKNTKISLKNIARPKICRPSLYTPRKILGLQKMPRTARLLFVAVLTLILSLKVILVLLRVLATFARRVLFD